jgi:hypothetical protein
MAPKASNLSDGYNYDVVVSTTQESINAGLIQYLSNTKTSQPYTYLFFLVDDQGTPSIQISLPELLEKTGGINPFEIPSGTPTTDPRVLKFQGARMGCAIRLKAGIPPGMLKNVDGKGPQIVLPAPVVTLGSSANNVNFNMYCQDITIIDYNPGGGWGAAGWWTWYTQPSGKPWFINVKADLVSKDLDKSLKTPYFDANPKEKELLLSKLNNLSGTAFSLQQLLFDLDNAAVQTTPEFAGLESNPKATYLLGTAFKGIWSKQAKERGEPLIGITAVPQVADSSPLKLTGLERSVSPVIDPSSGIQISNPSDIEVGATTLNYLCVTNGRPMPSVHSFTWNWIDPQDLALSSGVIAIKRSTIAEYIVGQMLPSAQRSCIEPWTKVDAYNIVGGVEYSWKFTKGQTPTVTYVTDAKTNGGIVATITYSKEARANDSNAATYGELNITSSYTCTIAFGGFTGNTPNEVYISQNLKVSVYSQWSHTGSSANAVDKTLTDVYIVSVDSNGSLTLKSSPDTTKHTLTDKSESGGATGIANFFTGVNDLIDDVKGKSGQFLNADIKPIPFDKLQNFIFPGGKVFTYKSAAFSDGKDLVSLITYVNPTDKQFNNVMMMSMVAHSGPPEPVTVDEVPRVALALEEIRAKGEGPDLAVHQDVQRAEKLAAKAAPSSSDQRSPSPADSKNGMPLATSFAVDALAATSQATPSSKARISSVTEMMLNYVQGQLVNPTGKLRALQMSDGLALLFAIDGSGTFNVFREVAGQKTGWMMHDISSNIIGEQFSGATVQKFGVNQSVMDNGTIGLGMAVRQNGSDTLLLSLSNASTSTASWVSAPTWKAFPFDASKRPSSLQITNISFSETDQGNQYIMVDILSDPKSSLKATSRYIVDPSATTGAWIPHTLPFDVEQGTFSSVVGRAANADIDGVYTAGTVQGAPQLAYVPMFNLSGNAAPMPTRLALPKGTITSAIASVRNPDRTSQLFGSTDFYAIGKSTLYRWSAEQQIDDNTAGQAILTNDLLSGTDTLVALSSGGITTLFGKNASNVVYYTSCPFASLADPNAWSVPVPVVNGIERIACFSNVRDGGSTIFVAGANSIQRLIHATNTESKIWQAQPITLAAAPLQKPLSFKSYTTTIKVTDTKDLPLAGTDVTLSCAYRTPVYIEGLYYVLSPDPIVLKSNPSGQLTIIQATESIIGAVMNASAGGAATIVNPMQGSFVKLAALADKTKLKQAQFTTNAVAGGVLGNQKTSPLVAATTSDSDLSATADCIAKLKQAYGVVDPAAASALSVPVATKVAAAVAPGSFSVDFGDVIRVAAGDLFNWLKTGVENFVQIVKDVATGVWNFIVKIASKVYHAVLSSVEAVVGAFEWVFKQIKTKIEDIIRYLEVLFSWDDIKRTKKILHNMIKFHLQDSIDGLKILQSQFDKSISTAQQAVAKLSGIKNWTSLGDSVNKQPSGNAVNPTKDHTPSSQSLANHFQNNAQNITFKETPPKPSLLQNLLADLITAIADEAEVFQETYKQLKALAFEFLQLSLAEVLTRLVGILTEAVLGTTQVIGDALFNVIHHVASSIIDLIDYKIHVPILSDILNAIGVPDVSFLDVLTWIGATGVTVTYKLLNDNKAPFADDATSQALIAATNWKEFSAVINPPNIPAKPAAAAADSNTPSKSFAAMDMKPQAASAQSPFMSLAAMDIKPQTISGPVAMTVSTGQIIFTSGHALAGWIAFTGNFIFFAEAMSPTGENPFGIVSAVMGAIGSLAAAGANALVSKMPIEDPAVAVLSLVTSGFTVASKLLFSGFVQGKLDPVGKLGALKVSDNRQVGAVVNVFLGLPTLFCTCWHFEELTHKPAGSTRSLAIIGETASLVGYVGRIAYTVAVFDPDLESRLVPAGVMAGCNIVMCGLETAAAIVT